jgi:hypothetical protein
VCPAYRPSPARSIPSHRPKTVYRPSAETVIDQVRVELEKRFSTGPTGHLRLAKVTAKNDISLLVFLRGAGYAAAAR